MPEGGDAGGREREEEEHGRRKPLRAFLFSLADRTTNTDVEKQADRRAAQPFCETPYYIIEDGSIAEERERSGWAHLLIKEPTAAKEPLTRSLIYLPNRGHFKL